ncbi:hypothetical protein ABZS86_04345 [Streptomyces sp. NPDC005355]|uniref:hypothetical protein n=1 Tax=Streptomyces sp. NPDC005355 TaxID=3157038 RepID=UPI0033A44057
MRSRLTELKEEYARGTEQLRSVLQEEAALRENLLRISGAIQVLEELMPPEQGSGEAGEGSIPRAGTEQESIVTAHTEPVAMTVR